MSEDEIIDHEDPDYIAERPPTKAIDPKSFFQIGTHEGKWSEYDERGVPTKSIKKKKPTKKEKDQLEAEYLEASKSYQKWLKDVQDWEQSKVDAEAALQKKDRLRWAFRQIGEKHAPIEPEELETLFKLMAWKPIPAKEMKLVKKGLNDVGDSEGLVSLEALRNFTREVMPVILMEERLTVDASFENVQVEDIYSPRTWRRKLDEHPVVTKKGGRSSVKGGRGPSVSPRGDKSISSPRGKDGSKPDRSASKKKTVARDASKKKTMTKDPPAARATTKKEASPSNSDTDPPTRPSSARGEPRKSVKKK